jgi:hypothetical protein
MPTLTLEGRAPLLSGRAPISWAPDLIDLSGLEWATPYDIVALAVICTRLAEQNQRPSLVLPENKQVRAYLVAVGLAKVIGGQWDDADAPLTGDPPLIPLVRLTAPDAWDDLLAGQWPDVLGTLVAPGLAQGTFEILSELADNATTHGQSPTGTFVCAQRYTGSSSGLAAGVWLGIADGGQGIPAHLRNNPKYKAIDEDEELIRLSRRPWVTGTRDRRGWGLVEVFEEAAKSGPSELVIRSGRGEGIFRLRSTTRPHARYSPLRPAIRGTWVHLRVEGG